MTITITITGQAPTYANIMQLPESRTFVLMLGDLALLLVQRRFRR
jgi:hypothetical protein